MAVSDSPSASKLIIGGNPQIKQIAVTFDAGPDSMPAPALLDVLAKHQIQATFFLTGLWAEKFPRQAVNIVKGGHELGNHSYDHPDMVKIPYDNMIQTVLQSEKAIEDVTGINTKPLFRQPFGSFNQEVLNAVGEAGYPYSIYWNVDPIDWAQPPAQTIVNRILYKARNGSIILLHIDGIHTVPATDSALVNLKARGFSFVTIGQLLRNIHPDSLSN